jgi:hypothetical protein
MIQMAPHTAAMDPTACTQLAAVAEFKNDQAKAQPPHAVNARNSMIARTMTQPATAFHPTVSTS